MRNSEKLDKKKWHNAGDIASCEYKCSYCDRLVASDFGYYYQGGGETSISICGHCGRPTFFHEYRNKQYPSPSFGNNVEHLPEDVEQVYNEARQCYSTNSFTSCVLTCRKLLMHIAVEKGAEKNDYFINYVNYIADNGYVPPDSKDLVERIRELGNEANHEIVIMEEEDAEELLSFIEMLLRFIYEFTGKSSAKNTKPPSQKVPVDIAPRIGPRK